MIKAIRGVVGFSVLTLAACGGDSIQSPDFTPVLVRIQSVAPVQVRDIAVGESIQFVATGCYTTPPGANPEVREAADCAGLPAGAAALRRIDVSWRSSNDTIVTIGASNGLATGVNRGDVTITGSKDGLDPAFTTLTVTPPTLQGVVIQTQPANATLPLGQTGSVDVRGIYSNSSTARRLDDGTQVTWRSLDPDVATVMPTTANPADVQASETNAGTAVIEVNVVPVEAQPGDEPFIEQVTFTVNGATLSDLTDVVCTPDRVQPGNVSTCQALGTFSDGTTRVPLDNDRLTWTSASPEFATLVEPIDPAGNSVMVSGVAEGSSLITAARADQPELPVPDSASTTLVITDPVCVTPIRTPQATATAAVSAGCSPVLGLIGCSVSNEAAVIDASEGSFATVAVMTTLVNGSASITATSTTGVPFPGGDRTGFIVGRPTGTTEPAEIVEQLQVQTILAGAVRETSTAANITADFLGTRMVDGGMDDQYLLSFPTTAGSNFDAVRFIFNSGSGTALVDTRVYDTCGLAVQPAPAPAPAP